MRKLLLLCSFFLLVGAGCSTVTTDAPSANSFVDCVRAGNPVMESYPRQCKSNGITFVEEVSVNPVEENIIIDEQVVNLIDEEKNMDEVNFVEQYNQAVISTNMGNITVEFFGDDSPNTVNNFLKLASEGFYDGTSFHRVISDFMIQGGDPQSKDQSQRSVHGTGGPGYAFADEFNNHPIVRGSLAMANSGPNTNGSQFFIVTADATPWLDGKHTNFGMVLDGFGVVTAIESVEKDSRDNPIDPVIIESIELITK